MSQWCSKTPTNQPYLTVCVRVCVCVCVCVWQDEHPAVPESAVVGVSHGIKGEGESGDTGLLCTLHTHLLSHYQHRDTRGHFGWGLK